MPRAAPHRPAPTDPHRLISGAGNVLSLRLQNRTNDAAGLQCCGLSLSKCPYLCNPQVFQEGGAERSRQWIG